MHRSDNRDSLRSCNHHCTTTLGIAPGVVQRSFTVTGMFGNQFTVTKRCFATPLAQAALYLQIDRLIAQGYVINRLTSPQMAVSDTRSVQVGCKFVAPSVRGLRASAGGSLAGVGSQLQQHKHFIHRALRPITSSWIASLEAFTSPSVTSF